MRKVKIYDYATNTEVEVEVGEKYYKEMESFDNAVKYRERKARENEINFSDANNAHLYVGDEKLNPVELLEEKYQNRINANRKILLKSAIKELSKEEREIISLHYYKGYSFSEIAEFQKKSRFAIFKNHQKIVEKLRKIILRKELKLNVRGC